MTQKDFEKRNFLFFLNEVHPLNIEDSLIGALATPSSWEDVAGMVNRARKKDAFVRSINKVQLYVHVPFCGRLCSFCHCSKELLRRRLDIDEYIKALRRQMMLLAPVYKDMDAGSICFGGGTPSILDERQMTAILDGVDQALPARGRRILFEINPSSWTASKLAVLSNRGLFRLSIGVQSLDEKVLKQVSRPQSRKKVLWCLRSARKAGVPHVNVDMMAGLPGQTVKGFIEDLKVIIDEGANIVHVYPYCGTSLTGMCAPGETVAAFFKRRDAMMRSAVQILDEAGFSRNGLEAYMLNGEDHQEEVYFRLETAVAGFGPSAIGQVPGAVIYRAGNLRASANLTAVNACAQDVGYAMSHYAMFAIMSELDEQAFFQRFGVSLDEHCGESLRFLQGFGVVAFSKGKWKYSGKWEIRRIHEFVALSRILFAEDLLLRLRSLFVKQYDPKKNYSEGRSFLKNYSDPWVMNLYYRLGF